MPSAIVRKLTPEQEELDRKREELAAVRAALAERELELADLRAQLKSFEGAIYGKLVFCMPNWTSGTLRSRSLSRSSNLRRRLNKARKRHGSAPRRRMRPLMARRRRPRTSNHRRT